MNWEDKWKEIGSEDDMLSNLIERGVPTTPSKDPLQKIKKGLLINACIGIVVAVGYLLVMIFFPVWQVFLCIGIVFLFTVWILMKSWKLYFNMNKSRNENSLLEEMKRHYQGIKDWMNIQQRASLLIYPAAAAGGFMVGGSLGAGKPISVVMSKPVMLVALVIVVAMLVPVCVYLAKWLNRRYFGKYAELLKENIERLQKEN